MAKPRPLEPGRSLQQDFVIREDLGADGMSTKHLAVQDTLGREIVLRTLHKGVADDPDVAQRFLAAVGRVGILQHAALLPVLGAGVTEEGTPWVAAVKPAGQTASEVLAGEGSMPQETALEVVRQVAEVLELAHDHGIAHGALDLDHVLVRRSPTGAVAVTVIDLGLAAVIEDAARRSNIAVRLGASAFRAPERSQSPPGARSDVYALGKLTEALMGGAAAKAVASATQEAPGDRVASPLAFMEALEAALGVGREEEATTKSAAAAAVATPSTAEKAATPASRRAAAVNRQDEAPQLRRKRSVTDEMLEVVSPRSPIPYALGGVVAGGLLAAVAFALIGGPSGEVADTPEVVARSLDDDHDSDEDRGEPDSSDTTAAAEDDHGADGSEDGAGTVEDPPGEDRGEEPDKDERLDSIRAALDAGDMKRADALLADLPSDHADLGEATRAVADAHLGALRAAVRSGERRTASDHLSWLEKSTSSGDERVSTGRELLASLDKPDPPDDKKSGTERPAGRPGKSAVASKSEPTPRKKPEPTTAAPKKTPAGIPGVSPKPKGIPTVKPKPKPTFGG